MKKVILCCATMLVAGSLFAAVTKEDVAAAAKKLGDQANYSWKTQSLCLKARASARVRPKARSRRTDTWM